MRLNGRPYADEPLADGDVVEVNGAPPNPRRTFFHIRGRLEWASEDKEKTIEAGIGWIPGRQIIWLNTSKLAMLLGLNRNTLNLNLRNWGIALINREHVHETSPEPHSSWWSARDPGPL
jgi:hypothetical protein